MKLFVEQGDVVKRREPSFLAYTFQKLAAFKNLNAPHPRIGKTGEAIAYVGGAACHAPPFVKGGYRERFSFPLHVATCRPEGP